MFEVKVCVEIPALDRLAERLSVGASPAQHANALSPEPANAATPPAQSLTPPVQPVSSTAPIPTAGPKPVPAPIQAACAPVTQAPAAPTVVKAYTLAELSKAATDHLMPQRANDLVGLLASFGVGSLVDLPEARYGEFATALRGMGANI